MIKKIIEIIKYVAVIIAIAYIINLLQEQNADLDAFKEKQNAYEMKMDSLKLISQQLVNNINALDKSIDASKQAIDDLKKKPVIVNYTNVQALEFLRAFAYKYNSMLKDSIQ